MELLHFSGVFDGRIGALRQDEWFPMKIAQIASLIESVPPRFYGGTERVVSYLTEELVAQGHEVTLFASGLKSNTSKKRTHSLFRQGAMLYASVAFANE